MATLKPKREFRPSVRKVPQPETPQPEATADTAVSHEGPLGNQEPRRPAPIFEAATSESYNFRFSAGKEFKSKFERLAEVTGVEDPHRNIEKVLETALEIALDKRDPKRKLERRRKREAKAERERGFRAHDVRYSLSSQAESEACFEPAPGRTVHAPRAWSCGLGPIGRTTSAGGGPPKPSPCPTHPIPFPSRLS